MGLLNSTIMGRHADNLCCSLQYMLWDDAAAEELVRTRYPRFLPTWNSYERVILRGDPLSPVICLCHSIWGPDCLKAAHVKTCERLHMQPVTLVLTVIRT